MSDFGTTINISKPDGKAFTGKEVTDLADELQEILEDGEYENALGEPFLHKVAEIEGEPSLLLAILSEHYYGDSDDENEETFGFVEETELEHAETIAEALKTKFPDLTFKAGIEDW
jgi:hypothetical protein